MSAGIGVRASWHTGEPQTEAAVFERIQLKPGEETFVSGALYIDSESVEGQKTLCFLSRAAKKTDAELELFGLDGYGQARVLTVHADGEKIFAFSLSLAWGSA